jgi:hypothetical protein
VQLVLMDLALDQEMLELKDHQEMLAWLVTMAHQGTLAM